jgi:putative transposase
MPKQTRHSAIFKAQVVLEMLKEERTVSQIAAAHQIHRSLQLLALTTAQ